MCRLQNTLRVVKLTSMQDEYAYLLTEDYVALISRIITEQEVRSVALALSFALSLNMQKQLLLLTLDMMVFLMYPVHCPGAACSICWPWCLCHDFWTWQYTEQA